MKRIVNVIVVVVLILTVFAGCNTNEMKVFNGILKNQEMTSYESNTTLKINIDLEGLSESERVEAEQTLSMINNSDISYHQKALYNEDKTKTKAQVNIDVNFGGMLTRTGVWVDSDLTGEEMKLKEIIQIPPLFMMGMPQGHSDKEYIVIDFSEMGKTTEDINPEDFEELITLSQEFIPMYQEFIKSYASDFNFNKNILTYEGTEKVNDETLKVYKLTLDDETFKEFMKYATETLIQSDATEDFLEEYIQLIMLSSKSFNSSNEQTTIQMQRDLEELKTMFSEESKTEALVLVDEFFRELKDIQILGDQGLAIQFKINEDGYIVHTDGTIHMRFHTRQFENFQKEENEISSLEEDDNVTVDIQLEFNTDVYNINQDFDIEMPEVTDDNSISLQQIMEIEQAIAEPGIKVFVDGYPVDLEVAPVMENGRVLVPIRPLAEAMGMDVSWDQSTQMVKITKDGAEIELTLNSNEAYINNNKILLEVPVRMIENTTFVPVRFVGEGLGADVSWDGITQIVYITH